MKTQKRKTIELNLGVIIVVIAITVIAITMLKYHVEGEKDMAYEIKGLITISTAKGENKPTDDYKWNINITQTTDVYIEIGRNEEYKINDNLKNVKVQDIQIKSNNKYKPNTYIPAVDGEEIFKYTNENIAKEEIIYTIDKNKNTKQRKLSIEGGIVALSFSIPNIGTYQGNDDQMSYDGTMLSKLGITQEQIEYEAKFSLIIETESEKTYKAEITLKLPQEGVLTERTSKNRRTKYKQYSI